MENTTNDLDIYEIEDYDLHFIKEVNQENELFYRLDLTDIDIDEHEESMLCEVVCSINYVDKVKRIKEKEFTD